MKLILTIVALTLAALAACAPAPESSPSPLRTEGGVIEAGTPVPMTDGRIVAYPTEGGGQVLIDTLTGHRVVAMTFDLDTIDNASAVFLLRSTDEVLRSRMP